MSITTRPPHAPLPVPFGTAQALATLAHFETLDNPDNDSLRHAWRLLIGPVPNPDEVWEHLTDELLQLWRLTSEDWDWDEDQLDELTEADWARYSFATQQQEIDQRLGMTIERLSSQIEGYIVRKRYELAELERATRHDMALLAVAR